MLSSEKDNGKGPGVRKVLTVLLVLALIATVILNALGGTDTGVFNNTIGEVSDAYPTCITPAGYTFIIWSLIYLLLVIIVIYAVTIVFRGGPDPDHPNSLPRLGGAVPTCFMFFFIINLLLNISWLFAFDHHQILASAILLILIAVTNIMALVFSARRFSQTANTLYQLKKVDFWFGVLTINGYAVYVTWTFLAANINLSIYTIHELSQDSDTVCIGHLSAIPVVMIIYAILEVTVFARLFNVLFTHYCVYLWASVGIYVKQEESASDVVYGLILANMAVAAVLCVVRITVIIVKNCKVSVYGHGVQDENNAEVMDFSSTEKF